MLKRSKLPLLLVSLLFIIISISGCSRPNSINEDIDEDTTISEYNVIVEEPGANLEEVLYYYKMENAEVSLDEQTQTTDGNGVATFINLKEGEHTLTIKKDGYENYSKNIDITGDALPIKVNVKQIHSSVLDPEVREFNLNNPENINTSIVGNGAIQVEGLYRVLENGGYTLEPLDESDAFNFNSSNNTLIINKEYLLDHSNSDVLKIFVKFDQGSDSLLTVNLIEEEVKPDAEINPSVFTFNLDDPTPIETIITWNRASEITSIDAKVQGETHDVLNDQSYNLDTETSTLTITAEDILANNPKVDDVLEYLISFDTGEPASLLVNITENTDQPDDGDDSNDDPEEPDEPIDDPDDPGDDPEEPEEEPIPENITITGSFNFKHNFSGSGVEANSLTSSSSEVWQSKNTDIQFQNQTQEKEVIIRFRSNLSKARASEKARAQGYRPLEYLPELNALLVKVPVGSSAREEVSQLRADPEVLNATPNNRVEIYDYTTPNDTHYEKQWGSSAMRLPQTWRDNTGSNRVRVAVLDTGVNDRHADLAPNLNLDDGYNFINNDTDTMDRHGHGTHVSGIIGAVGNNGYGIAGVMWDVEVIPVKVLGDDGVGSEWSAAQGILYAAGLLEELPVEPVDVINLSLGLDGNSPTPELIQDAVREASKTGVVIVAAAGNSGTRNVSFPAKFSEVIAVGALTDNQSNPPTLASYSSYGPEIEVVAPGSQIYSTIGDQSISSKSGTSMASPQVAGLAGLMIAQGVRPSDVRGLLKDTAIDLGSGGFDEKYGYGMINSYWAANQANEVNILVGTRDGESFNPVASTKVPVTKTSYTIENVPAGEYEVIAWLDVRANDTIENGDYFTSTGLVNLINSEYDFDFTIEEYIKN
ncbi:MAG: S8 family serine peptidase [Bacillota bacterium]